MVTVGNFFKATIADFTRIDTVPSRPADYKSGFDSEYWYEGDMVIRRSNHWGVVASCTWLLNGGSGSRRTEVGACRLGDFTFVPMGLSAEVNAKIIEYKLADPRLKFFARIGRYTFLCANEDHPWWSELKARDTQARFRRVFNVVTKGLNIQVI